MSKDDIAKHEWYDIDLDRASFDDEEDLLRLGLVKQEYREDSEYKRIEYEINRDDAIAIAKSFNLIQEAEFVSIESYHDKDIAVSEIGSVR